MPDNASNYTGEVITVTTATTQLVPLNANRNALILFNQGTENAKVFFQADDTVYFVLESGKGMYFPHVPMNRIQAKVDSGSTAVTVMEG